MTTSIKKQKAFKPTVFGDFDNKNENLKLRKKNGTRDGVEKGFIGQQNKSISE